MVYFPRLHIALVLYDFAICRCFYIHVLELAVYILDVQRPSVRFLCLYHLYASFRVNKIYPFSKKINQIS